MKARIAILISAASLALAACGGGGSGGSSGGNSDISKNTAMDGIYWGEGTEKNFGNFELIAFVQDGELLAISDTGVGYSGSLTINTNQNTYETRLRLYDEDSSKFDEASAKGTFKSKNSFNGSYTRSSGFTGNFEAAYSAETYEQTSSLEKVIGVWRATNTSGSNSVNINSSGDIYGTDSDGCVYSGEISIPDTSRNLYKVNFKIESCGAINGTYFALAATGQDSSGDWLTLLAKNANFGFAFEFVK